MKKIAMFTFMFTPLLAFAQAGSAPVSATLENVLQIINQIIPMLLALAVLMFMWGLVKFIANAGDAEARSGGVRHMVWGMIALFVMVAFWGIIGYVQESLSLGGVSVTTTPPPVVNVLPGL